MTSRTRVRAVLAGKVPDRVPRDYWAVDEITSRLCKHFAMPSKDALLDVLDIDCRYIDGPAYTGPPLQVHADGSIDDIWGVPRKTVVTGEGETRGTYKAVSSHPLAGCKTVEDVEAYEGWPDPGDSRDGDSTG